VVPNRGGISWVLRRNLNFAVKLRIHCKCCTSFWSWFWLLQLVISLYILLFSGQSHVILDKLYCHYLTTNRFCPTFINQVSVVQLQACGPHVTRHSVFSGPRKHSGKIFKFEICRNRNLLLALDKVHFACAG